MYTMPDNIHALLCSNLEACRAIRHGMIAMAVEDLALKHNLELLWMVQKSRDHKMKPYEKRVQRKTSANQSTPGSFLWLCAMLLMEVSTTNTIAQLNFAANRKAMLQTTGLLRKNLSVWNVSSLLRPKVFAFVGIACLHFSSKACDQKNHRIRFQMVQERCSTGPRTFFFILLLRCLEAWTMPNRMHTIQQVQDVSGKSITSMWWFTARFCWIPPKWQKNRVRKGNSSPSLWTARLIILRFDGFLKLWNMSPSPKEPTLRRIWQASQSSLDDVQVPKKHHLKAGWLFCWWRESGGCSQGFTGYDGVKVLMIPSIILSVHVAQHGSFSRIR